MEITKSCKGKCYVFMRYLREPKVYRKLVILCEYENLNYATVQKQLKSREFYTRREYSIHRVDLINKHKKELLTN
jgi:hypothetical protein